MPESANLLLVFAAGVTSVLSPCVLPVVPIVVTGGGRDHRMRPLLLVAGLSLTFVLMGVLSSLFGAVLGPIMYKIEKIVGILIAVMGVMLLFNFNPFKSAGFLSRLAERSDGRANGFILGLLLGIVWIPCVGPMLSGVLALVAVKNSIGTGVFLLLIYSAGFSIPMLIAGYASQFFRNSFKGLQKHPRLVNVVSGLVLTALGIFIAVKGVMGFAAF